MGFLAALNYDDEEVGKGNPKGKIIALMSCGCVSISASYVMLLSSIKEEYLKTFLSTTTSCEEIQSIFNNNQEDEQKFTILYNSQRKWRHSKTGQHVLEWLNERLPAWLDEEQAWFDDQKKSIINDDMVEDKELLGRIRTKTVKDIIADRRYSTLV